MDNHHEIAGGTTSNRSIPLLKMVADPTDPTVPMDPTATIKAINGVSSVHPIAILALVPSLSALAPTGPTISGSTVGLELIVVPRATAARVAIVITSDRMNSVHHSVTQTRIEAISGVTFPALIGGPTVLSAPIARHAILNEIIVNRAPLTASRVILGVMSGHHAISLVAIARLILRSRAIYKTLAGKADRRRGKMTPRKSVLTAVGAHKASCLRETMSVLMLR